MKSIMYNFYLVENIHYVQAKVGIYKTWPHLSNKASVNKFQGIGITLNTFSDYNTTYLKKNNKKL